MPVNVESKNKYWKSLEQWREDPDFKSLAEKEFLSSPLAEDDNNSGVARRNFLKLMGASMALTSFACTRRASEKIVPYVNRPEEIIPGVANYYASSCVLGASEAFGTVVTTREGRPIKIEGNTLHPSNRGGMSARAHAHILSLYDPDRLSAPRKNLFNDKRTNRDTISANYTQADKEIIAQLKKGQAALLTSSLSSPSTKSLCKKFVKKFNAKHFRWDAINYGPLLEGQKLSYGKAVVPRYRFDRAEYIVAVETDFLGTYLAPTDFTSSFAEKRKQIDLEMNRLVVFESVLSLTGTNADERYKIRNSKSYDVLMALAAELILTQDRSRYVNDSRVTSALKPFKNGDAILSLPSGTIRKIAQQLWENRNKALIVAGGLINNEATSVHVAANLLNSILGADGNTVDYLQGYTHIQGSHTEMSELMKAINNGEIKTLVIHGTNPVYGFSDSKAFQKALAKVELVVYTGDRNDETGLFSHYVLPDHHGLEGWSDSEIIKDVYSVQQPTIRPLGNTRSFQQGLLIWMGSQEKWHDYVKKYWKQNIYPKYGRGKTFDGFWSKTLQDGVVYSSLSSQERISSARNFKVSAFAATAPKSRSKADNYELVLYPTVGLQDGSLANVSWLQEFPDPVTKICWDNFISVSPRTAQQLKLSEGDVLSLQVNGKEQKAPVHIQPGTHDSVFGLAMGYGRWAAGKIANGVGVRSLNLATNHITSGLIIEKYKKTSQRIPLANVQGHHSMEGRQIVIEATLDQYKENPEANIHRHKMISLWDKYKYTGHKWGMSVDLNSCTGCGSCIIACQSENNIPTVGKKYVLQGREMHWMRVDRYFIGSPDEPDTVHQPLMCMHCDNAPCETVCPVIATVHSDEGINDMIYNRCVGTRYCVNNCPYKVRRFNWFDYTNVKTPLNMAMNPEVTVRDRGVMEKCTLCNHRIASAKRIAKVEKRSLVDGDILTACQQSCPAKAIVFGDMNDKTSAVSLKKVEKRTYHLLEELNTQPAITYQTKIRNTDQLKLSKGSHGRGH